MFAYSMREKTHAHRVMKDDVPEKIKSRRLAEIISTFYSLAKTRHARLYLHQEQLVLVDGISTRKSTISPQWMGKNEANIRVFFQMEESNPLSSSSSVTPIKVGDYVVVKIHHVTGASLVGTFVRKSGLVDFHQCLQAQV